MSIFRLLSFATCTHFSMSAFMKDVNSSGELIGTSSPDCSNHCLIAGTWAASFIAALSFAMIGSGRSGRSEQGGHGVETLGDRFVKGRNIRQDKRALQRWSSR